MEKDQSEVVSGSGTVGNPAIPSPIEGPTLPITGHKLNGQNFLQWARSVRLFLQGKGKEEYITGDAEQPRKDDPNSQKWRLENSLVMSWLLNTMTNEVGENFMYYNTAKEIWDAAKETYSNVDNTSAIFEIKSLLNDLRQGDLTVTEYFNTLTRYWQQLDTYEEIEWKCIEDSKQYKEIMEKDRIYKFLLGLNKNLDEVRGRVLGTKPLPKVREVFAEIRREESRRKVMLGSQNAVTYSESSALAAKGNQPHFQQKKGRPWCDHCRKTGHTRDTCWIIHGKPADAKSYRGKEIRGNTAYTNVPGIDKVNAATETSPFSKEQMELLQKLIAGTNIGTASVVQKGNVLNALNTSRGRTTSWIVDSGASDHMTGDITVFKKYFPCQDNSTVRIADGTTSRVFGRGSVVISKDIMLDSVLYVPKLDCNLLSVSKLAKDLNCVTKFLPSLCEFQDLDSGKKIGNAKECAGLYLLWVEDKFRACAVSRNKESHVMLWHYRLGHPNFMYLKRMFPSHFNKNPEFFQCEVCQMSKHARNSYPPNHISHLNPFP